MDLLTALNTKPLPELVGELMISDLAALERILDNEAVLLRVRKDKFQAILARRFEEDARKMLVANGKDTGTVNLQTNAITVKVVFAKKVEWDQAKLAEALNKLPAADARHYAKVELKVDERKFTAALPAIQAVLQDARTVKVAKPSFSFAVDDAEAT